MKTYARLLLLTAVICLTFVFYHNLDNLKLIGDYLDTEITPERLESTGIPILIWWTGFTEEPGKIKKCGDVSCFFTINRSFQNHSNKKAFVFYGTDFTLHNLPLLRRANDVWALLHEESPQNNWLFSNKKVMNLFNYTATFKRDSDYPLTLQWLTGLDDLLSLKYMKSVEEKNRLMRFEGLAPMAYIHSDCDTPSDRDHLVSMIQQYMAVDSYGQCLHNKNFSRSDMGNSLKKIDDSEFYQLLGKYKFLLSLENAVCDDYITEKFWRAYYVGAVPIVYGSPKIQDLLPTRESAILVKDYNSITDLVAAIARVNENDRLYERLVSYKSTGITNTLLKTMLKQRKWAINNDPNKINFVDGFECYLCHQLWSQHHTETKVADVSHYGCPKPRQFYNKDDLHGLKKGNNKHNRSFSENYFDQMQVVAEDFFHN